MRDEEENWVKKLVSLGFGAYFLTEESLKAIFKDSKLPKEILSGVLKSAGNAQREFTERFSNEFLRRLMEKIDPKELVQEILSKNDFEVTVQIRVKPRESSPHKS